MCPGKLGQPGNLETSFPVMETPGNLLKLQNILEIIHAVLEIYLLYFSPSDNNTPSSSSSFSFFLQKWQNVLENDFLYKLQLFIGTCTQFFCNVDI